jgi:hypothetical protein
MAARHLEGVPMTAKYDWHDSTCGQWEGETFGGERIALPCDCGMPELFRSAFADGERAGLAEAKRRLSLVGMHDGKCPEPDKRCTCGLNNAIDTPDPTPWYEPRIEA